MRARQAAAKAAREATNGVGAPPLPAVTELRPEVSSERLAPPSPSQPQASLQPVSQATAEPGPETAPDPELQEPEDALFQFLSSAEREAPFAPGFATGEFELARQTKVRLADWDGAGRDFTGVAVLTRQRVLWADATRCFVLRHADVVSMAETGDLFSSKGVRVVLRVHLPDVWTHRVASTGQSALVSTAHFALSLVFMAGGRDGAPGCRAIISPTANRFSVTVLYGGEGRLMAYSGFAAGRIRGSLPAGAAGARPGLLARRLGPALRLAQGQVVISIAKDNLKVCPSRNLISLLCGIPR
jgi:hypothetical protein